MWTAKFWKQVAERATKTAAQAVLLFWGGGDVLFNAWDLDWLTTAKIAAGGFVLSVLTSLGSVLRGDPESPSLIKIED